MPRIFTAKSIYGIRATIETIYENGQDKTYMFIKFSINKLNSAKYIKRLKEDVPNLLPATMSVKLKRSRIKEYEYAWSKGNPRKDSYVIDQGRTWNINGKLNQREVEIDGEKVTQYYFCRSRYKRYKRISHNGKVYPYRETLRFEIKYPLLFGTEFGTVFMKAYQLRELIQKLLSSYKAEDDLKELRGEPVTPEVNIEEVQNLQKEDPVRNEGSSYDPFSMPITHTPVHNGNSTSLTTGASGGSVIQNTSYKTDLIMDVGGEELSTDSPIKWHKDPEIHADSYIKNTYNYKKNAVEW